MSDDMAKIVDDLQYEAALQRIAELMEAYPYDADVFESLSSAVYAYEAEPVLCSDGVMRERWRS